MINNIEIEGLVRYLKQVSTLKEGNTFSLVHIDPKRFVHNFYCISNFNFNLKENDLIRVKGRLQTFKKYVQVYVVDIEILDRDTTKYAELLNKLMETVTAHKVTTDGGDNTCRLNLKNKSDSCGQSIPK